MSHTNSTANYQLPQFLGTDKPAWLTDVNQAFADIDTAMKANEVSAGQANALATQNASAISTQSGQISTLSTKVTTLETAQPVDEAQIETNRQNIATNAQNIVEIDNRLGHTSIADIGDGTITGAIDAINSNVPTVADMTGATASTNGTHGLVPAPSAGDENKVLKGDGTWGVAGDSATVRYNSDTGYIQYTTDGGTTWVNLINVSTPAQLLPTLTSNNSSPLGVASALGTGSGTIRPNEAYLVIDDSSENEGVLGDTNDYVEFTFTNPTFISYITVKARSTSGTSTPSQLTLDYSEDGVLWNNSASMVVTLDSTPADFTRSINATVKAIRVRKSIAPGSIYVSHFKAFN